MKYTSGYKYQVAKDETFYVKWLDGITVDLPFVKVKDCVVSVLSGYAWDGPSGPTIDTKTFMRGSLIHDVLYQLIRLEYLPRDYRDEADAFLILICEKDGMSKIRRWWVNLGVRRFAASAAHPDHRKQILTAP